MLFNSYIFILLFLPMTLILYFYLNKNNKDQLSLTFLTVMSLIYYGYYDWRYLFIIIISIMVNYYCGSIFGKSKLSNNMNKILLLFVIGFNLSLLGYYKYFGFFMENINSLTGLNFKIIKIALPLGISFFTFQQITYIIDSYRGYTKEYKFINYALFVTFFPQLIAGPIVHHKEMLPQFNDETNKKINFDNIAKGIFIFSIGLFKKLIIADGFAYFVNFGYANTESLNFYTGWIVVLSYTFQIYFDFSGYCDMAMGIGEMFNIKLPLNFNSPYKALNIQDFWRRWHITLGRFLTEYVYYPIGGNKKGIRRTYINLFLVFIISGIWHGAGWTFIIWGALHGLAIVLHRLWKNKGLKLNKYFAWIITFLFINITWIFFRANNLNEVSIVLAKIFDFGFIFENSLKVKEITKGYFGFGSTEFVYMLATFVILFFRNSYELLNNFKSSKRYLIFTVIIFIASFFTLNRTSDFLYYNF